MSLKKRTIEDLKHRYIYLPNKLRRYTDRLIGQRQRAKNVNERIQRKAVKGRKSFMELIHKLYKGELL